MIFKTIIVSNLDDLIMPTATKKCVNCKERKRNEDMIQPPNKQWFCDAQCVANYAYKKFSKQKVSAEKKRTTQRKQELKPKTKKLNELQALVNKYVRLRDSEQGCISCDKDKNWQGQWHASHYYSRGHSSSLRFNLHNIHKGCSVCNNHLSGNIGEYTPRLIEKIGQQKYDILTANKSNVVSYSDGWIARATILVKRKLRRFK